MVDYAGAIWLPNGNFYPNRNGQVPKYIILHGTAGGTSAEAIANYFASTQGGANPVSAHYVIGTDGTVVQCNSEKDGSWANGYLSAGHDSWWDPSINPNNITISIEHCKASSDNSDALTPAQQDASFKLIHDICQRWGIPARAADANGGITGHFSIDPVNRSRCPGNYPDTALYSFLNNGGNTMSGLPQGWSDDGTTLTAPNGHKVVQGFRDHVLNNNWDPANQPLEEEHGQSPLEISNPSLGDGTQQIFRWSVLEWTSSRGVFEAWSGQEMLAIRTALATANTEIAALKTQPPVAIPGNVIADIKQLVKDAGL